MNTGAEILAFAQAVKLLSELVNEPKKLDAIITLAEPYAEIERKYELVVAAQDKLVRDRQDLNAQITVVNELTTAADAREQAVAAKEVALANVQAALNGHEASLKDREKSIESAVAELNKEREALDSYSLKVAERNTQANERQAAAEALIKEYNEKLQSLAALSKGA